MTEVDFNERVDTFIAAHNLKPKSAIMYRYHLDKFREWAERVGMNVDEMNAMKLARFESSLHRVDPKLSESTVYNRVRAVRQMYRWLAIEGMTPLNDLVGKAGAKAPQANRHTLTLEELRAMWDATLEERDRVVFGLLALNALRLEDVVAARVEDVTKREGMDVLVLHARTTKHLQPLAVLPPAVSDAITRYIATRRSGALVLTKQGTPADRRTVNTILARLAKDAGISRTPTSLDVTFSLRSIAMERGFSYVGVLRSTGVLNTSQLAPLLARAPSNMALDSSFRMARLVTLRETELESRLLEAEVLLHESDAPVAVPAMLAGATLERHLRAFSTQQGIDIPRSRANITAYASRLRQVKAIPETDVQILASLAALRDAACHGWFEEMSVENVNYMLREIRAFIARTSPRTTE